METWPSIDPGKMRHFITIWKPRADVSTDASGTVMVPGVVTTAPCSIDPIRGTDQIRNGQTTTQLFLTIQMWFQPGILPDMQVETESGSRYQIQSIDNVKEMNIVLTLNCIALGANT